MTSDTRDGRGAPVTPERPVRRASLLWEPAPGPFRRRFPIREGGFLDAPSLDGVTGLARVRLTLGAPGARRWYPGALISLLFLVGFVLVPVLVQAPAPVALLWATGLVVFGAVFTVAFPIAMALPARWRWTPPVALLLLSLPFVVVLGADLTGLWTYVAVSAAVCLGGTAPAGIAVVATAALALVVDVVDDALSPSSTPPWTMPLVILSVGILMAAFTRNLQTLATLRRTQRELADVAVEEERNRVARDMHDILGHSLSAIALKADLAARLAERDPKAASAEIHDVQELARATLSDMRAVVSGYRQVRIASELASLRGLLPAAGITAHLPTTTDEVPEDRRELFGWALREATTNVIRHAGATACWVSLTPERITIEDDGRGPAPRDTTDDRIGTGLHGLAERAADAGGSLRIGRSPHGGFLLEVTA
ncbi:sensor histidine kinase [uncultured Microbacterium sp.]|uniref:sensor histidine kinase n=1 Tax=uncultured Microbacterium sp. TaxID=191216 RepID=UPI0025CF73E4|nr:sensor histidine kinase [uncultured Microbacterium sp.]